MKKGKILVIVVCLVAALSLLCNIITPMAATKEAPKKTAPKKEGPKKAH